MPQVFLDVDPRTLRASPQRISGADPAKLARQIARFGVSTTGMREIEVWLCAANELVISDGMTRATRVAKFLPGQRVRVVIVDRLPNYDASHLPLIKDLLP
jgi:hypothetical protein